MCIRDRSCIVYYCLGKLDEAQQCMETALTLNKFKNIEPSQGFILLFLATVLSLKNEKEHLPSHLAEVIAIGEKYDYEYPVSYTHLDVYKRQVFVRIDLGLIKGRCV